MLQLVACWVSERCSRATMERSLPSASLPVSVMNECGRSRIVGTSPGGSSVLSLLLVSV